MNCFLLLFVSSMFTGITGIALPPRGLSDPLLQESPDNSLWLASEDTIDFNSDPLLFAENSGIASFPPIVFDEASAVACDNTQSSLDPNTELFGLDARDLIDEFTGVQDLVAPLQQLPNSQCSAFTGQQQGPKQGAQRQTPVTDSPPETSIQQQQRVRLAPGICPLDYHYPLCCSGIVIGSNVLSCAVWFSNIGCPPNNQYCCRIFDAMQSMGIDCVGMDWTGGGSRGGSVPASGYFGLPYFRGD